MSTMPPAVPARPEAPSQSTLALAPRRAGVAFFPRHCTLPDGYSFSEYPVAHGFFADAHCVAWRDAELMRRPPLLDSAMVSFSDAEDP